MSNFSGRYEDLTAPRISVLFPKFTRFVPVGACAVLSAVNDRNVAWKLADLHKQEEKADLIVLALVLSCLSVRYVGLVA